MSENVLSSAFSKITITSLLVPKLRISLLGHHFRHVLPIHKHICNGSAVDILSMGHDTDWPFLQQLFEPLSRCLTARLIQFRRVDAPEPDAIGSDAEGVAVDGEDLLVAGESCIIF